jgi:uncharacterized membrane protein YgcG
MRLTGLTILILLTVASCGKETVESELTVKDRIFDNNNLLTAIQEDSIFQLINDLDKEIGSQIAIVTLDTLNGRTIEELSSEEFEKLRLGRDEFFDGLLIIFATKNKKIRIEVGYGLEKIIRDEIASRINRNIIGPEFKKKNYGLGLYKAVDTIRLLINKNKELVGQKL